jgi:hypothetical protein
MTNHITHLLPAPLCRLHLVLEEGHILGILLIWEEFSGSRGILNHMSNTYIKII